MLVIGHFTHLEGGIETKMSVQMKNPGKCHIPKGIFDDLKH